MIILNNYNLFIINLLFSLFPISFILGNLALNINIFIIIFYTLFFYNKKIFTIKYNIYDKILLFFFLFIFISLTINIFIQFVNNKNISNIIFSKTIFFYRYLFLYLILRFLISKKIINLKFFSSICAICAGVIIIDIFIQFIFGKNIIGMEPVSARRYTSFFGAEYITGGYLQKFSLFIFFLPFLTKINENSKILIYIFLFLVIMIAIVLTGNRMPLILFFFSFFVFLILNIKTRKYLMKFFIISFFILLIIFNKYQNFNIQALDFYNSVKNLSSIIFDADPTSRPAEDWQKPYVREFYCGKEAIKENPIIGGGIRFYRTFMGGCNSHPHNYFLEIVSDLGIFGLILILTFIYSLLFKMAKIYIFNSSFQKHYFENSLPVFLILICEFFPIRSSGSFFTTTNATLIFIMFAIMVSFSNSNKNTQI